MSIKRLANASITGAGGKSSKFWDQTTTMGTYESIATATVTSSGDEITFTNVPQNYSHLQIRVSGRGNYATGGWSGIYFNGSAVSGNYPSHSLTGNGSATAVYGYTNEWNQIIPSINNPLPWINATANVLGTYIWDILDYTSTSKNKVVRLLAGWDGNGSGSVTFGSGLWTSTAAITQIQISALSGFVAGSQAALYGIRGA